MTGHPVPSPVQSPRAAVLSPLEAHDLIQRSNGDLIVLDVRTPPEWIAEGCLAGATRIPMHELPYRAAELPRDAAILVYCAHGIRSADVGAWLCESGYAQVYDLGGGIDLWKRSGLPVTWEWE